MAYERSHRMRLVEEPYRRLGVELDDAGFDDFLSFLEEHRFRVRCCPRRVGSVAGMSRVCVFGDSITWGSWDPRGGGWVGRLREEGCLRKDLSALEHGTYTAVYNCGISGDKLADLLVRFDIEAAARQPAAVVIAIGINDIPHDDHPGTPAEEFRLGYEQLVAKARSVASDVVLVTPTNVDEARSEHQYRNADIGVLVEVVKSVGAEQKLSVVEVFGLLTPQDLEPDGLHPGEDGHARLHAAIAPTVFGLPSLNA